MYYVYALQSQRNPKWLYIGFSEDLKNRIVSHQQGKVHSTSRYLPLRLVYYEAYLNKKDATEREYELKHNSQQKEFLKNRISKSLLVCPPVGDLP
ncbi:MAG: GIY-YIG nuclease family protein [bacterium]